MSTRTRLFVTSVKNQKGLTLVELLVAIAVTGTLFSLILPAVQSARESSRKLSCSNRLKQVSLAIHAYESRTGYFPSFIGPDEDDLRRRNHNYIAFILSDIEQQYLADNYSFDYEWYEALRPTPETANLQLANTPIETVQCPSSPDNTILGIADFAICVGFASWQGSARERLLESGEITQRSDWQSMLDPIDEHVNKFRRIQRIHVGDGLSNSIMLCEDSGRPSYYVERREISDSSKAPVSGSFWADPEGEFSIDEVCEGLLMNCTNDNEIYSFHLMGANFAYGDGSVRFISENIASEALVSLLTRNAGD